MITAASVARRVASLTALLAAYAMSAVSAQTVTTQRLDAWRGCWSAAPNPGVPTRGSVPRVCVSPMSNSAALEISTLDSGKVVALDTIVVDGVDHPVSVQTCSGTKRAQWSQDGQRIFMRSQITCPGDLKRNTTEILAIAPSGEWLDIQTVSAGTNTGVRVTRYRDAGASMSDSLTSLVISSCSALERTCV